MTTAIVGIQARMSSSRLPGKSLADVAGLPLIQRVVDRARAASRVDLVCVLTSDEASDDPLVRYCEEHGILVRRGPLEDVFARYEALVDEFQPRYVVRVTGDCPLIDPEHIDAQLVALEQHDADFAPIPEAEHIFAGQGAFSARALAAAATSTDPRDREHVGSFYFARNAGQFRFVELPLREELRGLCHEELRLCVDEAPDLELVRLVFERFAPCHGSIVPLVDVLRWLDEAPQPRALNQAVQHSADNLAIQAMRRSRQGREAS